jgi:hypothetical protein
MLMARSKARSKMLPVGRPERQTARQTPGGASPGCGLERRLAQLPAGFTVTVMVLLVTERYLAMVGGTRQSCEVPAVLDRARR